MIKQAISKFFSDLKPMTWSERFDHIWTYYKGVILTVAFILFGAISIISTNLARKDSALCGVSVNIIVNETGTAYVEEEYLSHLDLSAITHECSLLPIHYGSLEDSMASVEYNYNQLMRPVLMVSAVELDYMLMDSESMQRYMVYDLFMDLRTVFTAEELSAMEDILIYSIPLDDDDQPLSADPIPVAIDISSLPFAQENIQTGDSVYLSFAINAPQADTLRDFWNWLNAWSTP